MVAESDLASSDLAAGGALVSDGESDLGASAARSEMAEAISKVKRVPDFIRGVFTVLPALSSEGMAEGQAVSTALRWCRWKDYGRLNRNFLAGFDRRRNCARVEVGRTRRPREKLHQN